MKRLTGRGPLPSPRDERKENGFRPGFREVGQTFTFAKTIGETDIYLFAGITGDFSDTHLNDQYMREKTSIGKRIAHGALVVGFMSTVSTHSIATSYIRRA